MLCSDLEEPFLGLVSKRGDLWPCCVPAKPWADSALVTPEADSACDEALPAVRGLLRGLLRLGKRAGCRGDRGSASGWHLIPASNSCGFNPAVKFSLHKQQPFGGNFPLTGSIWREPSRRPLSLASMSRLHSNSMLKSLPATSATTRLLTPRMLTGPKDITPCDSDSSCRGSCT